MIEFHQTFFVQFLSITTFSHLSLFSLTHFSKEPIKPQTTFFGEVVEAQGGFSNKDAFVRRSLWRILSRSSKSKWSFASSNDLCFGQSYFVILNSKNNYFAVFRWVKTIIKNAKKELFLCNSYPWIFETVNPRILVCDVTVKTQKLFVLIDCPFDFIITPILNGLCQHENESKQTVRIQNSFLNIPKVSLPKNKLTFPNSPQLQ